MVAALSLKEKNQDTINQSIRELQNGRNNATGTVTLAVSATSTTVQAPNCSLTSAIFIEEQTADAAAARYTSPWVIPVAGKGQFVLNHASNTVADRTFWWVCMGGN